MLTNTHNIELSVIIPVRNSLNHIESLCSNVVKFLKKQNISFEVLLCDDNSNKETKLLLDKLKCAYTDTIYIITLPTRYGQHYATYAGMLKANGNYIFTCDDDILFNENNFEVVLEAIPKLQRNQLLYFVNNRYTFLSRIKFFIIKLIIFFAVKNQPPKYGASQRIFTRQVAKSIIEAQHNYIYLDALLIKYVANVSYMENHFLKLRNKEVTSRYTFTERLGLLVNSLLHYNTVFFFFLLLIPFVSLAVLFINRFYVLVSLSTIAFMLILLASRCYQIRKKNTKFFLNNITLK